MPDFLRQFNMGLVTSRDRSELADGELQAATGIYYKPGDPRRAHVLNGRSSFGDTGSNDEVEGVWLCKFDSGSDAVLALSDGTIYSATPGASGTFSSLITSLSGSKLSCAYANDNWYIATGADRVRVLEGDGTTRNAGMFSPVERPVGTATDTTGSALDIPPDSGSGFTDNSDGFDGDTDTFAYGTVNLSTASDVYTLSWTGTSNTGTGRQVNVKWSLAGAQDLPERLPDGFDDTGQYISAGFSVSVTFEISEDNGSNYTTFFEGTYSSATSLETISTTITDSQEIQNQLLIRATITWTAGSSPATLRVYDCTVTDANGPRGSTFSFETGVYYAITEYDENTGLESAPSETSVLVTGDDISTVSLTLPSARQNTNTTHWRIYRTFDGGEAPLDLGRIASPQYSASVTTFVDDFTTYDKDTAAVTPLPLLQVQTSVDADPLPFARNTPPPLVEVLRYFKGSMVGLKGRQLFYSVPGAPEYWPEIYVVSSFPWEEKNELVQCLEVGGSLIVWAEDAVGRLDELPRVISGQFTSQGVFKIQGAPGCVGQYAACSFTLSGEPMAAWISPYGVYATNGHQFYRISEDLDWSTWDGTDKSGWVLHWDANRQVLIMSLASTTYYLLHMLPEHRKENGQAKVTGPHYGKIAHLASGQYGSTHRLYSSNTTDGKVYLEDDSTTGADASGAYSSTTRPVIVTDGRRYYGWVEWSALECRLRHGDFGAGETCTIDYTTGRDSSGASSTKSVLVSLASQTTTQLDVARSGEWHEFTLTYTGTGTSHLSDMVVRARQLTDAGKVSTT